MKVPEPRKLPSGSWFIQLRLGGVSVPVTASTARECKRQAELLKAEHRAGKLELLKSDPTLTAAIDRYILSRSNSASPSTIVGYRRIQKNRFQRYMQRRLSQIDLQKMADDEAKIVGPTTLRNSLSLVKSVFRANGLRPKSVTLPTPVPNERPFLEPEEIPNLVQAVSGTNSAIMVLLGLHSLRRSEILGLEWKDVDLKKKQIRVAGALVRGEDGKLTKRDANKNVKSSRTLPIMIPELQAELEAVPEDRRTGRVVPCSPGTVSTKIKKACEKAGVSAVSTHGLRHTFASLAYHLRLSEMETMELGGWSDISTVHKIYTHLAQKDRLKAENKIAEFFKNANENANESQKTQ